jgi:hypothetical protein
MGDITGKQLLGCGYVKGIDTRVIERWDIYRGEWKVGYIQR